MATATDVLQIIQDAAEHAKRSYPGDREMRAQMFIAYLSGALNGPVTKATELSKLVFSLVSLEPAPTATADAGAKQPSASLDQA